MNGKHGWMEEAKKESKVWLSPICMLTSLKMVDDFPEKAREKEMPDQNPA